MVRCGFDWGSYVPDRVKRIINYVASSDWVVAIFPYGLEQMGLQDVGGAGHMGFKDAAINVEYAKGEHSAALAPERWQEMADFVLKGTPPQNPILGVERDPRNVRRGEHARRYWAAIVIVVLGIAFAMLAVLGWLGGFWAPIMALVFWLYIYVLRVVLTRA
jgi:hypothetical protein